MGVGGVFLVFTDDAKVSSAPQFPAGFMLLKELG